MSYEELIAKALRGRKPAQAARDWQIPPMTLYRYVTGERTPDCTTTILLAKEAGIGLSEAVIAVAEQESKGKTKPANIEQKLSYNLPRADVAQSVEQLIRNQ